METNVRSKKKSRVTEETIFLPSSCLTKNRHRAAVSMTTTMQSITVTKQSEPFFFNQPTILVTNVRGPVDFVPPLVGAESTAQCINRIARLSIIIAIVLSIILRSWWPIVTVGGLLLLATLIAYGVDTYNKQRAKKGIVAAAAAEEKGAAAAVAEEEASRNVENTRTSSSAAAPAPLPPPLQTVSATKAVFVKTEGEGDAGAEEGGATEAQRKSSPTTLDSNDFSQVLSEYRVAAAPDQLDQAAEEREDGIAAEIDTNPVLPRCAVPLCAVDNRYNEIVAEQTRLYDRDYGAQNRIAAQLEQCAPYDPTATIPQPSRRKVVFPVCQDAQRNNALQFGDGSCARGESAADKEERAIATARLHGNPNVGRVSTMIGINAEQATMEHLPNAYRKSSMTTSIDNIYDSAQQQGPAGTSTKTAKEQQRQQQQQQQGRPMHDPTERFLNDMWADSTEQIWKTQFLDRRPPPFLNPAHPSSRKLEEQAAVSRSQYRGFNMHYGP